MKRTVYVGIFLVCITLLTYYLYQYATDSPYRISSQKAKEFVKTNKFDVILDVRTDLERSSFGFYPGSVHIQSADLESQMPKMFPDKQTRILAYCNTGHRARMATDKLHNLGYKNALYISSTYNTIM